MIHRTDKQTSRQTNPVRIYAEVPSSSRRGLKHIVTFLRREGMKRWSCTCESFIFYFFARRRQCAHIHKIRRAL